MISMIIDVQMASEWKQKFIDKRMIQLTTADLTECMSIFKYIQ